MPVRYITVTAITNMFKPATRAFGDVAIVGAAAVASTGPMKRPIPVTNPNSVTDPSNVAGANRPIDDPTWFGGDLGASVKKVFEQSPGPTTVWAVRTDPADAANALTNALAEVAKIDVQIVALANTPLTAAAASVAQVNALASHVSTVSNIGGDGKERIGVAMLGKDVTDPALIANVVPNTRMVLVAHRSNQDAAAAVAGAIAGYEPHISVLLKPISLTMDGLFSDSEIDAFNTNRINWITDPVLLPGRGYYLGEAYTLNADQPYIDIIRTIDDISFRLKAQLIRSIGTLRVSRSGLRALGAQMIAVLEPLRERGVIERYDVFMPLLVLLDKEPGDLSDAELQRINNAQNDRTVDSIIEVDYAGAIHRLNITLKFQ